MVSVWSPAPGIREDRTLLSDWWGRGEEVIPMEIQGSWDSKVENEAIAPCIIAITDLV